MPKRVFVFQCAQSAKDGSISRNPFNFQHFNLSNVNITKNGASIPLAGPISVDKKDPCVLYRITLDAINDSRKVHFNSWEFMNGYMLMCFNTGVCNGTADASFRNPVENGTLRVRLDYAKPLAEPITVFCMAEYDDVMLLDNDRNVMWQSEDN